MSEEKGTPSSPLSPPPSTIAADAPSTARAAPGAASTDAGPPPLPTEADSTPIGGDGAPDEGDGAALEGTKPSDAARSTADASGVEVPPYPAAAWKCSAETNDGLVDNLKRGELVASADVERSLRATDRGLYVPKPPARARRSVRYKYGPYADAPQHLLRKGATVSAPHMHAMALELLAPWLRRSGERRVAVLDVGSGSGVLLAAMARMVGADGRQSVAVGVEVMDVLVDHSAAALRRDGFAVDVRGRDASADATATDATPPPTSGAVTVIHGDGWAGAKDFAPFDAIHVGAGADEIPKELVAQLAPNGALLVPVGDPSGQVWWLVEATASGGEVRSRRPVTRVRYVPLVHASLGPSGQHATDTAAAGGAGASSGKARGRTRRKRAAAREGVPSAVDYDARYRKGWAYGKAPSAWLVEAARAHLGDARGGRPLRVLSLGEGQGRNAAHLASLGCFVRAVDASPVGLAKALLLAKEKGVGDRVEAVEADLNGYAPDDGGELWDAVMSIFCALPPDTRAALHAACAAAVKPGGLVLVECFAPGHEGLGPPREWLVAPDELAREFGGHGFDALEARVVRRERFVEGAFHRGAAVVTQFVARRRIDSDSDGLRASMDAVFRAARDEAAGAGEDDSGAAAGDSDGDGGGLRASMDALFRAARGEAAGAGEDDSGAAAGDGDGDELLRCATEMLRVSCAAAAHSRTCRYCWVPAAACLCAQLRGVRLANGSRKPDASGVTPPRIEFVVVSHPNEFLRSTSTARVAAAVLSGDCRCELLAYGSPPHMQRLDHILAAPPNLCMLYPDEPDVCARTPQVVSDGVSDGGAMGASRGMDAADTAEVADAASATRVVTVLVPDGSHDNAAALAAALTRRAAAAGRVLPMVRLDDAAVAAQSSAVMDVLYPGSGAGRLSTLEAMCMFVDEAAAAGMRAVGARDALSAGLDVLVRYLGDMRRAATLAGGGGGGARASEGDVAAFQALARAACATSDSGDAGTHGGGGGSSARVAAVGLRSCGVCGAALATPKRMRGHLVGRRHCEALARAFRRGGATGAPSPAAFEALSSEPLRRARAEPPDVAFATVWEGSAVTQCGGTA